MKIVYLAHASLFDDWAHNIQIMKMCEAFSQNGVEVTLLVPDRKPGALANAFQHHGVTESFIIKKIPYIDIFYGNPNSFFYWVRYISFLISARVYLFFVHYDVLYTREIYFAPFFSPVFLERHSFPKKVTAIHSFVFRHVHGLVVLTSFIKAKIVAIGMPAARVLVAPDAVRLSDFTDSLSQAEARKKYNLPPDVCLFGYVGTLKTMNAEKGVATAIESLIFLPPQYILYVVGGEKADIDFYANYAVEKKVRDKVIFAGKVQHSKVAQYIAACDILVAPFPFSEHYAYYMSPLKIFEYMASHRPIVATTLPSLEEILTTDKNALLVPPSDPQALAQAIIDLHEHKDKSERIAQTAYAEVVEKYTWKQRACGILKAINL